MAAHLSFDAWVWNLAFLAQATSTTVLEVAFAGNEHSRAVDSGHDHEEQASHAEGSESE